MLDVQAALTSAGVPGYRDAFRPTPGAEDPPDVYCVYQETHTPALCGDDEVVAELVHAQLWLFSANSPKASQAAIDAAMKAEDFFRKRRRGSSCCARRPSRRCPGRRAKRPAPSPRHIPASPTGSTPTASDSCGCGRILTAIPAF